MTPTLALNRSLFSKDKEKRKTKKKRTKKKKNLGIPSIHGIRKRDLLVIATRDQPHFMDHPRQRTSRIGSTGKSKYTDFVASFVCECEERLSVSYLERGEGGGKEGAETRVKERGTYNSA